MDFAYALRLLKEGKKVTRASWQGKLHLEARRRGVNVDMVKVPRSGDIEAVGWLAPPSGADLFAEDWSELVSCTCKRPGARTAYDHADDCPKGRLLSDETA